MTIQSLAKEIDGLSPPDKLRLAADLLEAQRPELAKTVIEMVSTELGAALLLAKLRGGRPR